MTTMNAPNDANRGDSSRRNFLRQTSVGLAGAAATAQVPLVHAGSGSAGKVTEIKIGLVGCGGRGAGGALDAPGAATKGVYPPSGYHTQDVAAGAEGAHSNINVVALAHPFAERVRKGPRRAG